MSQCPEIASAFQPHIGLHPLEAFQLKWGKMPLPGFSVQRMISAMFKAKAHHCVEVPERPPPTPSGRYQLCRDGALGRYAGTWSSDLPQCVTRAVCDKALVFRGSHYLLDQAPEPLPGTLAFCDPVPPTPLASSLRMLPQHPKPCYFPDTAGRLA